MRKYLIFLLLITLFGCTKEYSIAEFKDDFDFYKSELRIEAILFTNDFMKSIVRVDKTILVTDTTLFNGRDDNGDWVGYTDVNNNGVWDEGEPLNDDVGGYNGGTGNGKPDLGEPHVDDLGEILPMIHDSTMKSIELREKNTGTIIAEFEWKLKAGIFEEYSFTGDSTVIYNYGAYVPASIYANTKIDFNTEYEFRIGTKKGNLISGVTKTLPNAEIEKSNTTWNADTLVVNQNSDTVEFAVADDVSLCAITLRNVFSADSLAYHYGQNLTPTRSKDNDQLIIELTKDIFPAGLSKLTISVLSKEYGDYLSSDLPLRNPKVSNLRDNNGNTVLGVAGSSTETEIYVRNNL